MGVLCGRGEVWVPEGGVGGIGGMGYDARFVLIGLRLLIFRAWLVCGIEIGGGCAGCVGC